MSGNGSSRKPSQVEREIAEQPAILERIVRRASFGALAERIAGRRPLGAITVARGSSGHAAELFSYLVQAHLGLPVASFPPSIATLHRRAPPDVRGQLALGISQSGRSPDVVRAFESLRAGGAFAVAVTNDASSPLARAADEVVPLECGPELSVPATKTFTASLAAAGALVAAWRGSAPLRSQLERLPEAAARALELDLEAAAGVIAPSPFAFVVGRGFGLGVALEGALKLGEIARVHAEGKSAAEILHGPIASVDPGLPAIVVVSPRWDLVDPGAAIVPEPLARGGPRLSCLETAFELSQRGARVVLLGADADWARCTGAAVGLSPNHGLPGEVAPIVQAIALQRLAVATARARGLDPDAPPGFEKVTATW